MIRSMEGDMTQTTLASLKGVRKRFGAIQALDGLDLSVRRGELLAVLGPNGAGKTTAIGMLLGLQSPDEGSAELFGVAPQEIDARRRIGVMMQEVQLAGVMRPRELLEQVASYYPVPYDLDSVIERLSLQKLMKRPYGKLSGGQKRQVQFALALCGRPELLFLDEPTAGLDVQAREALWKVIRELVHEGCSIVLTTHYLEEAEALADRVAVVMRGKLVTSGTVNEIRANESRKLVSCVTRLTADTVRAWPEVAGVDLARERLQISTRSAEAVLVRLLREDPALSDIEVKRAGLAEAFTELTNEKSPEALS
ncbi:MAG: ABC transporter ATP-binding protein [Peristeroidobacter soli]